MTFAILTRIIPYWYKKSRGFLLEVEVGLDSDERLTREEGLERFLNEGDGEVEAVAVAVQVHPHSLEVWFFNHVAIIRFGDEKSSEFGSDEVFWC